MFLDQPRTASWATLSRPCGTQFPNEVFTQGLKPSSTPAQCGTAEAVPFVPNVLSEKVSGLVDLQQATTQGLDAFVTTGNLIPSNTVPQIFMSFKYIGATAYGSSFSTVKFAILGGSMEPSSSPFAMSKRSCW